MVCIKAQVCTMADDLQKYSKLIENNAANKKNELVLNDGVAHNAIIMTGMFNHAKEICMFCGVGSIYRKEFYEKVVGEQKTNAKIMEDLHDAINKFIDNRNNTLDVILENADDFLQNIHDNIKNKLNSSNVKFRVLSKDITPEYHFSIGDNCMYRREIGRKEHKAFANFNDTVITNLFQKQFSMLKFFSSPFKIE